MLQPQGTEGVLDKTLAHSLDTVNFPVRHVHDGKTAVSKDRASSARHSDARAG